MKKLSTCLKKDFSHRHQMHCVFVVYLHSSIRDRILRSCEHNTLRTTSGNFIRFTAYLQFWTTGYILRSEGKRSRSVWQQIRL